MTLRPVRIDFVPAGIRCHKCRRLLEEARVVLSQDGTELFYGPECVRSVLSDEGRALLGQIPDLTRRGRESIKSSGGTGGGGGTQNEEGEDAARHAAEYLWIRLDKIAVLCSTKTTSLKYAPLVAVFDSLKSRGYLLDAEVLHVLNIEHKAPPELKLLSLLDVYAADTQLQKKIGVNGNDFLRGLQQQLWERLSLSQKQIGKAGLKLPKTAFAWRTATQPSK